ncbi:MAG: aminodeoxychorismate lyase [Thiobacillaceae bacterium]
MTHPLRILVNGEPDAGLSASDRGLMYGDGVFRTIHVRKGRPLWWSAQLAKLAADAERLGIPPPPPELWEQEACQLLASSADDCVLKLVLTRGPAMRGYKPSGQAMPTRLLIASAWPAHVETVAARGAHLHLCRLRLSEQPLLAGIKHLNRLEHVLAAMEWSDPSIDEGLLLDAAGRVICAVSGNVFIYRDGALFTPRLDRCGVAGVARARLMGVAAHLKLNVHETDIYLDQLLEADEVMLTNSLIKIWRVARLFGRTWEIPRVSGELRTLLDA